MARRDDVDKLRQQAEESEDLATLESVHKQFVELLGSLNSNISSTTDEDVLNVLTEMRDEVQYADDELKRKIAEIKVDMLDPAYAQRKAEREQEKLARQREEEMWKQKFANEGIGGIFKGLGDMFGGGAQLGTVASTDSKPSAAELTCSGCGTAVTGPVKFCPECGNPVVREKLCAGCGTKLEPKAKFCPECGTKTA